MWGCAGVSRAALAPSAPAPAPAWCSTKHQGPTYRRVPGRSLAAPSGSREGAMCSGGESSATDAVTGGRTARAAGRLGGASVRRGSAERRRGTGGGAGAAAGATTSDDARVAAGRAGAGAGAGARATVPGDVGTGAGDGGWAGGAGATGAGGALPGPRSTSLTGLSLGPRASDGEDRRWSCRPSTKDGAPLSRGSAGPHDLRPGAVRRSAVHTAPRRRRLRCRCCGRPSGLGWAVVDRGALRAPTRPFSGRPGVQFSPFIFLSGPHIKASPPHHSSERELTALSTAGTGEISRGAHPCGPNLWITRQRMFTLWTPIRRCGPPHPDRPL